MTASAHSYDDTLYPQVQPARLSFTLPRAWSSTESPTQHATMTDEDDAIIQKTTLATIDEARKRIDETADRHQDANKGEYTEMGLLTRVLERKKNYDEWQHRAAKSRSFSLPIVLLQIIIRHRALHRAADGQHLLQVLPSEAELQKRIAHIAEKRRCAQDDVSVYAHILAGKTDDERCGRLLEHRGQVPIHLLLFLLRPTSTLRDVATLRSLIDLYKPGNSDSASSTEAHAQMSSYLSPANYLKRLSLVAKHLVRTEPRLLVDLAEAACAFLRQCVETGDSRKRYVECCRSFNRALQIFQPKTHLLDKQIPVANAYFWESQRMLLTLSDTFERPLQVSGAGFRAIRNTLAGMPKNEAEKHSALLHAPSWPPYLTPGDGMDEITDPESNWSRTVEAGMLMQEAGFAKSDADESLDILKGLAPDGTPTIQQRTLAGGSHRIITAWEASIRATRDAHEAWGRFNEPLSKGAVPGVDEYAAMFEKLTLREASATSKLLPGDKARNFPAYRAANLADIEWAKTRPPSVSELYSQMRHDGIVPAGHCLFILVSNAPDLETANRYLVDAAAADPDIASLVSRTIDATALRSVGMGLFSAYISVLTKREDKHGWENLHRAIALAEARLGDKRSRWVSLVWGAILKGSSRPHSTLRMSRADQVKLVMAIGKRIDRGHRLNLANFAELNKSLRKIIRHDLPLLIDQLHNNEVAAGIPSKLPLRVLYDAAFAREGRNASRLGMDVTQQQQQQQDQPAPAPGELQSLVDYIKQEFRNLQRREASYQAAARDGHMSPLDRMLSRGDVVKSEHALEYMLTMAYAGEFQEMRALLLFLIGEWSQPDVVAALEELGGSDGDAVPASADFSEVLCVFRLLGEQMLLGTDTKDTNDGGGPGPPQDVVAAEMQSAIEEAGLPWRWPDVTAVQAYLRMQPHDSIRHVRSVLTQMRAQKRAAAQAQAETSGQGGQGREDDGSGGPQWHESLAGRFSESIGRPGKEGTRRKGSSSRWPFQARQ